MKSFAAEARERFMDLRWPDPSGQGPGDETWRRTDISRLDLDAIALGETRGGSAGFAARPLEEKWKRAGIRHLSLEEAMRERGDELETILREGIEGTDKPAAWHYSALSGGSLVCVPAGVEMDEPIVLDYEAGSLSRLNSPHLFVLLGRGARASVVVRLGASGAEGTELSPTSAWTSASSRERPWASACSRPSGPPPSTSRACAPAWSATLPCAPWTPASAGAWWCPRSTAS
jgi:hypothetical protein